MSYDRVIHNTCLRCGSGIISRKARRPDGSNIVECLNCGERMEEFTDPRAFPVVVDTSIPMDVPIRDEGGNIYFIRVKDGRLTLFDVDDSLVKKWWEVWRR